MHVGTYNNESAARQAWMHLPSATAVDSVHHRPNLVEISGQARDMLEQAGHEQLLASAMSLEQIQARINVVRAEIVSIWDSPLPDEEKYRLIGARENEIALLQAGQFAFARAGFHRSV